MKKKSACGARTGQQQNSKFKTNTFKNAFYETKKKRLRRAQWPNKKKCKQMVCTLTNSFYEENKSACGVRTGAKKRN